MKDHKLTITEGAAPTKTHTHNTTKTKNTEVTTNMPKKQETTYIKKHK